MARDILGKSLFVDDDICNCDANEEQVEHTGASVTNAEADAAAPMVAAAAVATNDFIFHYSTGLLWEEMRGLHGRANKTHVEPDGRTESDIQSSESTTQPAGIGRSARSSCRGPLLANSMASSFRLKSKRYGK